MRSSPVFEYTTLDPRASDLDNLKGREVLGIEVTEPRLAELCSLGNIDPQHSGGDARRAAIEDALSATIPPRGTVLATIRPDLDSFGAMAVLTLRANGVELSSRDLERVRKIALADTWSRARWPGRRPLPDPESAANDHPLVGIGALVNDSRLTPHERVSRMMDWITSGTCEGYDNAFERAVERIRMGVAETEIWKSPSELTALTRSTSFVAVGLAYRLAPVVIAENPESRSEHGLPYRKLTIAQFESGWTDLTAVLEELNELEPGWGGSPTIGGSPQGRPCELSLDTVLQIVEKHSCVSLLVYPFGKSDLQRPAGPLDRRRDRLDALATLLTGTTPTWTSDDNDHLVWRDEAEVIATMPILGRTLRWLSDSGLKTETTTRIALRPILTDQGAPDRDDTICLWPALMELERVPGSVAVQLLDPWALEGDPSDYSRVHAFYGELFSKLCEAVPRQVPVFIQTTTGTPAMSFAASVFSGDPDITFVYTPWGGETQASQYFPHERRRATRDLLERMMRQLDWSGAARVLSHPGNGYCGPRRGSTIEGTEVEFPFLISSALHYWRSREYQRADVALGRVADHTDDCTRSAAGDLQKSCRSLSQQREEVRDWVDFWRHAARDAVNRLACFSHLGAAPETLLALYQFNDAFLTGAATNLLGQADRDLTSDRAFSNEPSKLAVLLERGGEEILDRYLPFHYVLEHGLDEMRNRLVHGGLAIPRELLADTLRSLGLTCQLPPLSQFFALASSVLEVFTNDEPHTPPVFSLSNAITVLEPGASRASASTAMTGINVDELQKALSDARTARENVLADVSRGVTEAANEVMRRALKAVPALDRNWTVGPDTLPSLEYADPASQNKVAEIILHGTFSESDRTRRAPSPREDPTGRQRGPYTSPPTIPGRKAEAMAVLWPRVEMHFVQGILNRLVETNQSWNALRRRAPRKVGGRFDDVLAAVDTPGLQNATVAFENWAQEVSA